MYRGAFNLEISKKITYPKSIKKLTSFRLDLLKDNLELVSMVIPAIICLILFNYLPMFGVVLAFKEYSYVDGIFGSKWVGFDNFRFFFTSQDALRVTVNTVLYNSTFIVVGMLSAVIVAILLFEISNKRALKIYQTSIILPNFMSWVVVSYITYIILYPSSTGMLNKIIAMIGMEPVSWYSDTKYWPYILTVTNLWKHIGMDCIIYYAALMGTDQELFDAAKIDGANKLQQTWYISIPTIVPVMTILFILAVGGIFGGDFGLFYQISRDIGTLYPVTDIIPTYVFRGLMGGNYAMGTAVGLFQSVVGLIMVLTTNLIVKKMKSETTLF